MHTTITITITITSDARWSSTTCTSRNHCNRTPAMLPVQCTDVRSAVSTARLPCSLQTTLHLVPSNDKTRVGPKLHCSLT